MMSIKPKIGKILPNADVIIYNSYDNGTISKFIRYDLKAVFWNETEESNNIKMGITTANSVNMFVDKRINYVSPLKWSKLTRAEIEEGIKEITIIENEEVITNIPFFTIQKGDMIILSTPETDEAPDEFSSTVDITKYFGIDYAHQIMSVDKKILPDRTISHFEIAGK